ncbi:oxidase [Sulfodiicoccus acidiphilus]|uniref:Oxidase n=2 Tax=Sulfodiicoccus acidiphilus TaxID=1670455 RepID=A0A348B4P7_9CREN|nr:oxidase [Sulfodiicoccus acidiphilus]GGU00464.1 oxidase [Sulfodiicoccus acidiphilus]
MLVMGVAWGFLGTIDSLMVRIQETLWGFAGLLQFTPQEYYGAITLHASRDLFGFAQQIIYAIIIFFTIRLLNLQPRAKWLLITSFVALNVSMMFIEGPIILTPTFNDNYFAAGSWYYLSPLGIPGYSSYVLSPFFYFGWLLLDFFTYGAGIWIVYHYYVATRQMKQRLPVPVVFFLMIILLFMLGYSGVTAADVWDVLAYYHVVGLVPIDNQILFWIFGHSVVYMLWLPAVAALYLLVPILARRPLYSERMGRLSALLYLIFSNNVPIHHLYMVNIPVSLKILQEVFTYAVVVPSMMTFFNLWATAKGAKFTWNVISAFTVTSFAGAIGAGVTGIANGTIAFDAVIHNTMWVVGHFHAMILLSIVPGAMAVFYYMMPMLTGREWYSKSMAWGHFWGYVVGAAMISVGFDQLGLYGIVRRSEIYPRFPAVVDAEGLVTVGAVLAATATLLWGLNVVMTVLRGKLANVEGLPLDQVVEKVGEELSAPTVLASVSTPVRSVLSVSRRALSRGYSLGVLGAALIVVSSFVIAFAHSTYDLYTWTWIVLLTIGIFLVAIPVMRDSKAV